MGISKSLLFALLVFYSLISNCTNGRPQPDDATGHLSLPNMPGPALERIIGLGVALPYPYFQKPNYRYPVYDREGKGYPMYGYGGKEMFRYTKFDKVEGHH